jgi:hypothetical protein
MLVKTTIRDAAKWFPILLKDSQGRIYYEAVILL